MRKLLVIASLFVLLLPGVAQAWDVDKSAQIPDVDKPALGGDPNDNSCWQAAAANILAAAGWGTDPLNLGTTQAKAENIYAQMNQAFGTANMGCADKAVNYWLYMFALNPNAAVPDYQPNASTYTDVTTRLKIPLVAADYNLLLTQLSNNEYVVVGFDTPPHCMTLTGGNRENAAPPGTNTTQSIWHDSDTDVGNGPDGINDDVYFNDFIHVNDTPAWDLAVNIGGPWHERIGQRYVVIAPGLSKPTYAMENYDVAYFWQMFNNEGTDTDGDGELDELAFRLAGTQAGVLGSPQWGAAPNQNILTVQNQEASDKRKEIWLLIDYTDATWDNPALIGGRTEDDIYIVDDEGKEYRNPVVTHQVNEGQLLYYWLLDDQPLWEQIVFPDDKYRLLTGDVKDWDLAMYCSEIPVPEPAGLVLIGMALLALRKRRS